eukprot:TRINITY_DN3052_c0_g1_i2.p1 TRINITY_DN3052_c0_g1~~TRINITY_DN3052_c0_g1_i2.p1  ORF type:complete len:576 (+),score=103.95 TRINITY_DN3052_c0_g1_i2:1-1728(+)
METKNSESINLYTQRQYMLRRRTIKNTTKIGLFLIVLMFLSISASLFVTFEWNSTSSIHKDTLGVKHKNIHERRIANKIKLQNSTDDECSFDKYLNDHVLLCEYLQSDICQPEGFINYRYLYYCSKIENQKWLSWIFFIGWILVLFIVLGTSADEYFCPALSCIVETFHIPPDIAGLTLMALGNGAPDVSGTIVAVKANVYGISIGELLGAGVFVTTIVVGAVAFVSKNVQLDASSFLRDVIFYLVALGMMCGMLYDGKILFWEAVILLIYYFTYVTFAIIYQYRAQKKKKTEESKRLINDTYTDYHPVNETNNSGEEDSDKPEIELPLKLNERPKSFFDFEGWLDDFKEKSFIGKVWYLVVFVVCLPLKLTIPLCEEEDWSKLQTSLSFIFSIPLVPLTFGVATNKLGHLPAWGFCIIIGFCLFLLFLFVTKVDGPPRWKIMIAMWAFFISFIWIYLIANEIVSLLQTIGQIMHISDVILGSTALAWGDSLGDLISDVVMAKEGFPKMAIAATYGGPLFNLVFGSGVSLLYVTVARYPAPYLASMNNETIMVAVCIGLVSRDDPLAETVLYPRR